MQPAVATLSNKSFATQPPALTEGRYTVRLAVNDAEIDSALRLRFNVFNLELGEGMTSSYITGRDEDKFDAVCDHLIAIDDRTGEIVGTYRINTLERVVTATGFYCSTGYDLSTLSLDVLRESLEIGRACIAKEHRHTKVLYLLWKGLALALRAKNKRYLFGCCSLTTQDTADGIHAFITLEKRRAFHQKFWVAPRREFACKVDDTLVLSDGYRLPKLFEAYLRFGAKVCSPPAIDREFGTIDFLVIFDMNNANALTRKLFLS